MAEPAAPVLEVDVAVESPLWRGHEESLVRVLQTAAQHENRAGSVSLLLGDDAAIEALNKAWRGKEGPTNVLSFPAVSCLEPGGAIFWGDIALAAETIVREAENQGKSFAAHAAHMTAHGFLHLLGYDHQTESEAEKMERRERDILAALGVRDPYA